MGYENIIMNLEKGITYTRKDLFQVLAKEYQDLSFNSFKWILSDMTKSGIVSRKQRGLYVLSDETNKDKSIYQPYMGNKISEISTIIETRFPMIDFVCFDSVQLNEFLNHLIAKNTHFIMVEKDAVDSVFRFLQEENVGKILLKPSKKEWDAYWSGDVIVMLNLVSESPKCAEDSHGMCIEQLLVDIVAEKSFNLLYSNSEVQRIYDIANERYLIDHARLFRYARRRGKEKIVKMYMEGYVDAYRR